MSDCSSDIRRTRSRKSVRVGQVAVFAGVESDKAQALKVLEEASEVVEAWKKCDNDRKEGEAMGLPRHEHVTGSRDDLLNEIADVVQAAMNLAAAEGVADFSERMNQCRIRNERKGRSYT